MHKAYKIIKGYRQGATTTGVGKGVENKRTFFGIFSGFFLLFFAEILYEFFVSAWAAAHVCHHGEQARGGQPNNYMDGQHNLMNIGNDEK